MPLLGNLVQESLVSFWNVVGVEFIKQDQNLVEITSVLGVSIYYQKK
jgi:hypothetical protein